MPLAPPPRLSLRSPGRDPIAPRACRGDASPPVNNMAAMRPGPSPRRSRLPARGGCRSSPAAARARTRPTSSSGGSAESRPAPPKSDFPSAKGKTLAEVLEAGRSPSELVVSPAALVFYKGENRFPFGVFEQRPHPGPRRRSRALLRQGADRSTPKAEKTGRQGRRSAGPRSKPSKSRRSARSRRGSKPSRPSRLPRPDDEPTTPTPPRVVYSTEIDFPSDGEWRIAARDQGRRRTRPRRCCRAPTSASSSGSRGRARRRR